MGIHSGGLTWIFFICLICNKITNGTDLPLFDPVEARRFFDFAAASYTTHVDKCLKVIPGNFQLIWKKKTHCDWNANCFAYISMSTTSKAIVIAFRGSTSSKMIIKQALENLGFLKKTVLGGSVYRYFYNAYKSFRPEILKIVKCLVKDNPTFDVWVTGHSLGGAIASIMSAKLLDKKIIAPQKLKTIVFGMPRVGTYNYARSYDKLHKHSFRVVHRNDIVPHLPPCLALAPIADCIGLKITTHPYHHGTEVWYDNDMASENSAHKVCLGNPVNEDAACSNSRVPIIKHAFRDHVNYYGVHVSTYGKAGCPGPKPPPAPPPVESINWGIRLWGHYNEFKTGSAEACKASCIADQICQAMTFGTRNLRKGWNSCYLYITYNRRPSESGWATWFKSEEIKTSTESPPLTTIIPELEDYDFVSDIEDEVNEDSNYTAQINGCDWAEGPCLNNIALVSSHSNITNNELNDSALTVQKCQEFCDAGNHTIAALSQGNTCHCGFSFSQQRTTMSNACILPCVGNANQTCGGVSAMSVWIRIFDDYDEDDDDDDNDDNNNDFNNSSSQSLTKASSLITTMTTSKEVRATTVLTTTTNPWSSVKSTLTTMPLINLTTVTVARTSLTTLVSYSAVPTEARGCRWTYKGCYANNPWNLHVLINGSDYIRPADLTVETCETHCLRTYNYRFASLDYGNACHCGTGFLNNVTRGLETGCTMPCPGNKLQMCGGPWINSVYECA